MIATEARSRAGLLPLLRDLNELKRICPAPSGRSLAEVGFRRDPASRSPMPWVEALTEEGLDVTATIGAKGDAVAAYRSQLGFQFGDASTAASDLRDHAVTEAARLGVDGAVEVARRTT